MQTMRQSNTHGFTLIEILVAVLIFALLTGIAIVSFQTANRRARDGRRQADLEQVRTALEIYRADNTSYPTGSWAAMVAALQPSYLSTVPVDPRDPTYSYYYGDTGGGTSYNTCAYLEGGSSTACPAGVVSCGSQSCNYGVTSP